MTGCGFTLIIPALNPDEKLIQTVSSAVQAGIDDIIIVNDGSSPQTLRYFDEIGGAYPQVTILSHERNLGKGAALKTAFAYYLENRRGKTGVVTADSDGQHKTEDILACAHEMESAPPAVVLGCRDFSLENVPAKSRMGNRATSTVFRIFFGMKLSDTQTGLRAIPDMYIKRLMEAAGERYEYETNMLILMGQLHIPYRELKIETVYFEENRASHFRPVRDSIRVYGLILKYAAASLASAGVDILTFFLLGRFIITEGSRAAVLACTLGARIVSSVVNFCINRRLVFDSRLGAAKTFLRYVCIAVPVMLASWLSVYGFSALTGAGQAGRTLIKVPVDTVLFLLSFRMQKSWVFAQKDYPEEE